LATTPPAPRELTSELSGEAADLSVRLRPGHRDEQLKVRCRQLYGTEFSCRAKGRLPSARGGVRLELRGRMWFDARGARRYGRGGYAQGWNADMRATLTWKRCPQNARRRSLRGKPCELRARWSGSRPLYAAFGY
jgi:hypothetical protein